MSWSYTKVGAYLELVRLVDEGLTTRCFYLLCYPYNSWFSDPIVDGYSYRPVTADNWSIYPPFSRYESVLANSEEPLIAGEYGYYPYKWLWVPDLMRAFIDVLFYFRELVQGLLALISGNDWSFSWEEWIEVSFDLIGVLWSYVFMIWWSGVTELVEFIEEYKFILSILISDWILNL